MTALIVIPTYDEAENIAPIIARVLAAVPSAELLIVDDASPDGTGVIVDDLARRDPRIHVMHRPGKDGLGAAYRAGFAWALARDYTQIVEMDADGSHDPADLPALLIGLADHDVATGSRWTDGGTAEGWALSRRLLSRGGSRYAQLALGIRERDVTGGFRAYRAEALRAIQPDRIESRGYSFQIELLWRAHEAGLSVIEVPITFVERARGVSKMRPRIILEGLVRVTRWGISRPIAKQLFAFLAVGSVGFVVDIAVFNMLRLSVFSPDHMRGGPLIAKAISTSLAILVNWLGNRYWTFRDRRRADVVREATEFVITSVLSGAVALLVLGISHYGLHLRSPLADNISANGIGLALGSALRFVAYREWVFSKRRFGAVEKVPDRASAGGG